MPSARPANHETSQSRPAVESHHPEGEQKHTNRLVDETSPYLLQHAHNPVDWYPWGEEAFAAAREQYKPIFMSIGYSTCYWCHVMERESFESEEIAAIMNEHFINVKVDREERPDVDDIYMTAVQMMTGSGGWPMSVFLEPKDLKPFYGGTYFPAEEKPGYGRPSFPQLLEGLHQAWANQNEQVLQQADQIAERIEAIMSQEQAPVTLTKQTVESAVAQVLNQYDPQHAGFGGGAQYAPKFPMPANLDLLLQAAWENPSVRDAVTATLDRMATGGMYDQIGGGFHRYSVDRQWLVPHFEKMLYDNGQLASTYSRAYEQTEDPFYAWVTYDILEYVLREMTGEHGGFYSAQDAEVNAREGQNYLWLPEQIRKALTDAGLDSDIDFTLKMYGLDQGTNFTDPHHPEDGSFNVIYLPKRPDELADELSLSLEQLQHKRNRVNEALLAVRSQRDQPGTDGKIITGWNGLMIAGMADGGRVLGDEKYIDAAKQAADFVLDNLNDGDGGLLRTYREGQAKINAFFEDYAYFIHGLLALHTATGESRWLDEATRLTATAKTRFWDESHGGYYDTLADQSDLFVRTKSSYDGAVPSGMSVMINNLVTLHEKTGDEQYRITAATTLRAISATLASNPVGAVLAAKGLDRYIAAHGDDTLEVEASSKGAPSIVAITAEERAADDSDVLIAIDLILTVQKPWHINAHKPGDESLIPLSVKLTGAEGLELEVDYPEGKQFDGPIGSMIVHDGEVRVPIRLRRIGSIGGNPQIVVTHQACDDKQCLAPQTEVIPIDVSRSP